MRSENEDNIYRTLVETAVDFAIISLDAEGFVRTWNSGAQRMFQYRPEEAIGQLSTFIFTAEDQALGEDDREVAIAASEGRARDDRWHVRRDGSRLWANGVLHALRGENGVVQGFVKVIQDRTDERRMQESLRTSEEQFARLFLGNPAAVAVERRIDERLVLANESFFRLIGYWRAETMGHTGKDLGIWADPEQRVRALAVFREHPESSTARIDIRTKQGETRLAFAALAATEIDNKECVIYTFVPTGE